MSMTILNYKKLHIHQIESVIEILFLLKGKYCQFKWVIWDSSSIFDHKHQTHFKYFVLISSDKVLFTFDLNQIKRFRIKCQVNKIQNSQPHHWMKTRHETEMFFETCACVFLFSFFGWRRAPTIEFVWAITCFFSIRVLHFILCERANVSHPIPSNRHANGINAQMLKLKRLRKHHYDDHSHLCFRSSFALRCFALVHARCCSQVPFSSSSFTFLGYS